MEENNIESNKNISLNTKKAVLRRRDLLPVWIKIFMWVFLVFFALMPVAVILGILGINFQMNLLGLATNHPISITGAVLLALFIFKGIIALALWQEKIWAVGLAKIDAIISLVICSAVMLYSIFGTGQSVSIRLEFIAIIPYLIRMNKIQSNWENFGNVELDPLPGIDQSSTENN